MIYRHLPTQNFEDLSCGRVIYNFPGLPNFPVRLAGEIFFECLNIIGMKEGTVSIYDPCCGSAYLLTVLGFLCGGHISHINASDISEKAAALAAKNLSLLTAQGLKLRKEQLAKMYADYQKQSHLDAIKSAERLEELLVINSIPQNIFTADITDVNALSHMNFKADIIITDVPYGNLTSWSEGSQAATANLLNAVIPVLSAHSVVAVVSDKSQKTSSPAYERAKKMTAGKRKIEFFTQS